MKLDQKVAVVTGAASGMGEAIAKLYAREGASVVVADLNEEGANAVTASIKEQGGQAVAVKVNVAEQDDVNTMIETAVDTFGSIDILVNNAGIMDGFEPAGEITDEKWDLLFEVNTKSVMRSTRKALPYFLEKEAGVIVNIASSGGLNGAHAGVSYTASKHAVVGITKNTGYMYADKGIRCNAIAPGGVQTNIASSLNNVSEFGSGRLQAARSVMPRVGQADEIAKVALFLASDDASFVNGTVVTADAGWTSAF
ncbi:3-oxoacyl-[acyl-carrier protein] reductase [Geomicrobium sp. JCM 19037]|uniref:SDR family oxidoreductase n=1 Tax=unclassified Geomicrobium TaxID=2628951 RepID=UPI00045F442B|nr:SDR family oxidoreductase [Geomicrobium sp. JCM 19037]GAK04990.1 3-oxoacyl-[acyl-carrier protein] reductase [Geomicrobium sp. JCM 19037]